MLLLHTAFDGSIVSRCVALLGPLAPPSLGRLPRNRRSRRRREFLAKNTAGREIKFSARFSSIRAESSFRCDIYMYIATRLPSSRGVRPPPSVHHALLALRSIVVRDFGDTKVRARWQVKPSAVAGRDPPARRQICFHDSRRRTLARSFPLSFSLSVFLSVPLIPSCLPSPSGVLRYTSTRPIPFECAGSGTSMGFLVGDHSSSISEDSPFFQLAVL